MKNEASKLTPKRKNFNEKYDNLNEIEIQKEILFSQRLMLEKLEQIRTNTSTLVWFLIIIPIIVGVIIAMMS